MSTGVHSLASFWSSEFLSSILITQNSKPGITGISSLNLSCFSWSLWERLDQIGGRKDVTTADEVDSVEQLTQAIIGLFKV